MEILITILIMAICGGVVWYIYKNSKAKGLKNNKKSKRDESFVNSKTIHRYTSNNNNQNKEKSNKVVNQIKNSFDENDSNLSFQHRDSLPEEEQLRLLKKLIDQEKPSSNKNMQNTSLDNNEAELEVAKKIEEEKKIEAAKKLEEEKKLEAAKKIEEEKKIEAAKKLEEEKKLEAAKKIEEEKKVEAAKKLEEEKKIEAAKKIEAERNLAAKKLEDQKKIEANKKLEEERKLAAKKLEDQKKIEANKKFEDEKKIEATKKLDEERKLAAKKLEEEKRIEAAKKLDEERKLAIKKLEEEKKIEAAKKLEQSKSSAINSTSEPKKTSVLIVDDARFMRIMIRNILQDAGYDIVGEAETGKDAIKLALELKPDIITMDITMPDINGITALEEILKKEPKIKIIMLSADDQSETIGEALKAGALNFISKPFEKDNVLEIIGKVIKEYNYNTK